ncbi:carboxypeptidase M32 [[Clostridium] aminophilum]|uniref:Metal-dependent carboxypeptidase n=1 Tax=[Clostridium] aminophilum TaxID=1526 RepID=A0A1I6JQW8_9FIRM|nr:carboxypeptidase M32 [[Clostridium] aminophilum]SFR81353.1 carboxypeptidase Taq [[Clostridium] aminophilum]
MSFREMYRVVEDITRQFRYYKSIESLFQLDQWTQLPEEGAEYRQKTAAFVAEKKDGLFRSPEAKKAAEYFREAGLDSLENDLSRGVVRTFLYRYRNAVGRPEEKEKEYNLFKVDLMKKWKEAREAKDYRIFLPYLDRAFVLKKEIALGICPERPAFDTLVDLTDEGLETADVDREFEALKTGIRKLMERIEKVNRKTDSHATGDIIDGVGKNAGISLDDRFRTREEDPEKMSEFARRLAYESGYRKSRGYFNDQVIHGFTSFMGPRDSRISTYRNGSIDLIYTCMHEAGHAMYATGGSGEVNEAGMWGGIEGGFHEAMSRFNENMIARSREYWQHYYPMLAETFPRYREIPEEEFYRGTNRVAPSVKRISADEVTYSLHAILRYEMERDFFSGALSAEDMAEAWNDRYEAYLGIRPKDDTEGILQDMHWAGDFIGYFQSYALGNIYDGQILEQLLKEIPDIYGDIAEGRFERLNGWMDRRIRQYGCVYTGTEMIRRLTGQGLDAGPFLRYLNRKYEEIYSLS